MAVPKKKHSKQRSKVRHSAWQVKTRTKLVNDVNVVTCSNCSARIKERTICTECGFYKGVEMKKIKVDTAKTVVKV